MLSAPMRPKNSAAMCIRTALQRLRLRHCTDLQRWTREQQPGRPSYTAEVHVYKCAGCCRRCRLWLTARTREAMQGKPAPHSADLGQRVLGLGS